jgi:hypothetical protein
MPRRGDVLKKYEIMNLLFFAGFILVLGAFVAIVFHMYRTPTPAPRQDDGILSEFVTAESESCLFYVEKPVSEGSQRYRGATEIPPGDDGFLKELFAISGVSQVLIDKKLVVIQKTPSAHWEIIRPRAREVIHNHLHLHKYGASAKVTP